MPPHMFLGVCTTVDQSAAAKAAGWNFVEERVEQILQPATAAEQWAGAARAAASALPVRAANVLVPPAMKITGPDADPQRLRDYMDIVLSRAAKIGITTLVFGSGGARNVPPGFDRDRARIQIVEFLSMAAALAEPVGVTLAVEHMNRSESNIINTMQEAMTYVLEVKHPNVGCLVDSYHFWQNGESHELLHAAVPWLKHVHVANVDRSAPGVGDTVSDARNDYRSFFGILKRYGYVGPICVEAIDFDLRKDGRRVLEFLKDQWTAC